MRHGQLATEDLSRTKPAGPPAQAAPLVDASPEIVLLVTREGTLIDYPTAANLGELLGPDIAARVLEGVERALDSWDVGFDVWESNYGPIGERSYCQGRFTCAGFDEVLVLLRDATMDTCRHDAEQHVSDLGRSVVGATNLEVDAAVQEVIARTAAFVGGRSGIVLVPDDGTDFTIAHVWEPIGMPTNAPPRPDGELNWLTGFVEDLDEPVILDVDDLPEAAARFRSALESQALVAVGLIPLVCEVERLGVIAVGFAEHPDRVGRLRFQSLGALGPLLVGVLEREQRQRDEWLRSAEGGFRELMHRSPDLALGLGDVGQLVFVSPSVRELLGYEPAELLGTNAIDLVHPDDAERTLTVLRDFPTGGSLRSAVYRIRHRDGSWRKIESVLTDMRDDPTVGCLVAVARDVTEQVDSQDALRHSEEHIRALLHYSADLIAVIDTDGRLLHPTPNDILGYAAGSLVGFNTLELVHPEDLEAARDALTQACAHPDQPVRAELRVRHSDGGWLRFEFVMTNHIDDPLVGGIIANGHDVTKRVEAECERAESEAQFRFLADRASDMIYRFSMVGKRVFEYVSPASEAVTGFTPAEYYANPELMLNRLHPDDRQIAIRGLANPDADGTSPQMRLRMRHKDGTWVWTEHRAVPILDEHGQMVAAEGIARDITEQVRAEDEILERDLFSRSILESLQGPAIVVDVEGTILAANVDWLAGMVSHGDDPQMGELGTNYLELCDEEASRGVPGSAQAAAGLRAVLSGAEEAFRLDYPVYGPDAEKWFMARVSPLRTATGGAIVHHVDITDRKVYEQQLARQALRDPLTGLANRALLSDRLDGAIARARPRASTLALLLLDLDRFNVVNDGLGHATGDDLLVAVAARLRKLVPPGATVARLGGDEFVVLCEGIRADRAAGALAERIVDAFNEPLQEVEGEWLTVTVSIGVALGNRKTNGEELLRRADAAMHHAKRRGRKRFEFFDKRLHSGAFTRFSVESELHRAIERFEFRLDYQPVVNLRTGVIEAVEALLRWQHPTRGLLLPDDFLGVAEDAGLLVPVGDWVLREATDQARRWRAQHDGPGIRVAVNVAAQQMHRAGFPDDVRAAIAHAGIEPSQLILELTESTLMDAQVARTAKRLHDLGVRLAIDDFGTGYSSMSYLKRFAVDEVKIDRTFVDGLGHDPDDATIVGAIVNMTHTLGLVTIAEGVETTVQRDALIELGCELGQGFLFGRAGSPEAIDHMLAAAAV